MTRHGVRIDWGGETLELRPERALLLPAHGAVLVADLHLGKAHAFRRQGVPVPGGTTRETLARLDELVESTAAAHVVVLGDLLHARSAQAGEALGRLGRWRASRPALEVTLVRGNHDTRAGDPPDSIGIRVVAEPFMLGRLALCHHPDPHAPDGFGFAHVPGEGQPARVAGHAHPCVSVHGRRDSLRLPCFHFAPRVAVLPAFGEFTGMHPVRRVEGDAVWMVAEDRVLRLPG